MDIIRQNVGDGVWCHVRGPGCQDWMFESQVRVFKSLKVKFEWLKGQRSVQHPEHIRVNECTPRECTSACEARGFLKVEFECFKVKFEWLRGQRSVQHPKDIRVNECTPRECTSACKARGFLIPEKKFRNAIPKKKIGITKLEFLAP